MAEQVLGASGRALTPEVRGRPHHHEAERFGKAHLHDVPLDGLVQAHAGVMTLRDDVHEAVLDDDVDRLRRSS